MYNFPEDVINTTIIPNKEERTRKQRYSSLDPRNTDLITKRQISVDMSVKMETLSPLKVQNKLTRQKTVERKKKAVLLDELDFNLKGKDNEMEYQFFNFKSRRMMSKNRSKMLPVLENPDF